MNYFVQRDVVGDDPSTPQVEPSEPFTLGLLATNLGQGTASNFTITSAQPKIVENQKGLLIDFNIIGSQVGDQPTAPSLTVDLGDLNPGQTQVATWSLTSSLAGQFIDYSATFTHDNALGGLQTSIIDSVAIHELVHAVQANRPGDDDLPDFLADDSENPDGLPDTLYMSDGTIAPVSIATSITTDGPVTADHREVQLTADQSSGWSYIQVADPGYGWKLERVVRSDGVSLLVGPDVWQTDKVFNTTTNKFDTVPLLHLLDYNGTGSYTLYYVKDISTPPAITTISPVSPDPRNAPVDSIDVTFSEAIDPTTFDDNAITLTRNGGPNLITGAVNIQAVDATDATYQISGLTGLTAADGAYTLTVSAAQVVDLGDNTGSGTASINWSNGIAPPYVKQVVLVGPSIRNTAADAIDVQLSLPIDSASFTTTALSLTRDGAVVALPSSVTVSATDGTGTDFEIQGLSAATTPDGTYGLTVDASGLMGTDGLAGLGTASASWVMDTTPPALLSVQQPTTTPRNTVIQSFDVTFSKPIILATFGLSNLLLQRDGSPITLDDRVAVQPVGGAVYSITGLNWFMGQQGAYTLTVDGDGVQDLAGNVRSGEASASWVMETIPPDAPTDVALTPDRGVSDSDGLTDTEQVSIIGSVDAPGLNIRVYDNTTGHEIGLAPADGLTFSIPVDLGSVGNHELWVNAVDAAGNVSDNAVLETFIDETPPTVVQINGVPAAPTTSPVDALDVVFSKAINLNTLDAQALTLTLNGGPNLITDAVSISLVSGTTYRISGLTGLTGALGSYQLSLDLTKVQDLAGNAGQGTSTVSWTAIPVDSTPPTSSATSPTVVSTFGFTVQWSGQDNPGGSGIAYYDVYSNEDGGPFTLWQYHTTSLSATFLGSDQHTYAFFSIATDVAGNQEPMKTVGDTSTFVSIRGAIHGRVFEDVNQSGTDTAGAQNGLQGWTVFLDLANDGRLDAGDPSTTTGSDGSFAFSNLEPGTYTVAEVVQSGWQQTYPAAGGSSVQEVQVSVGTSDAPVYLADAPGSAGTASDTAVNQELIGLDQFQNDPRFSDDTGQGETVVVLDSGVDVTNPYFGPVGPEGLAAGIAYQYDFVDNTSSAPDPLGHGTLVSSIIGSRDAANPGVAPGVQIIDLKVLDDSGQGDFATVQRALQWVADNVAQYNIVAVNMSFGDGGDYAQPQSLYGLGGVLSELASEGVITVSAAGNNFYGDQGMPGVSYPAADPNSLAVGAIWSSNLGGPFAWANGAVDYTTAADQIMSFSQRDNGLGEVFAPGAFIQGASADGGVQTLSGTSMAAPAISGVAALADQVALQALGRRLLPSEFRYLLATTSVPIEDAAGNDNVANTGSTYLRVDVDALAAAILALKTNPIPPAVLSPGSAPTGGTASATSIPSGEQAVEVGAGDDDTGVDFGNYLPGTVSGTVYLDADGDGSLDNGETGLAGWTVTLHRNSGTIPDQTFTTDSSGTYTFGNLAAGSYTLSETVPTGYRQTQPGSANSFSYTFTVTSEFAGVNMNFGNVSQAATATAVTPGTASVGFGQSATFTATVSSAHGAPPDGSVQFLVNGAAYGSTVPLSGGTAQLAITEPVGSYTVAAQYTGDANYAPTLPAAETSATLTVLPAASPATNLAISPNTGISNGITDTGAVTFTGKLSTAGMTVDVFDTSTNTDLGNATVTGTSFSLALNLAEGGHVLRARATLNGTYADAFFTVLVDLTKPTSHVVNSLGTSQSSDSFPVSVAFSDPAGSGGAPASGVSSVDLYVSVNNGPFSLYQTLNVTPAASGTTTFTFAGQDRNLYAFHSIAHDAAGNTESKSSNAIEASTSVPDLNPPVTHILASSPSYSWGPFSSSSFSGLAPSSYNSSTGVFTLNWAGADPDQDTGVPAGSIALVNIYAEVDGGAPALIGQPNGGTPNGSGVYTGSITYNALADGLSHTYSFFSVGVDDQQKKQYAPQAGPSAPDVTFSNISYSAPLGVQKLVVEDNIAERSFIQYLDVDFNQSVSSSSVLQGLANELAGTSSSRNSYVELLWYGENQTLDGSVNLFNTGTTAKVTLTGNDLSINIGPNGITSLLTGVSGTGPTKTVGDGWYALDIDPTGNGQGGLPWLPFFRLLGSATGDTTVSGPYTTAGTDAYTVYHAEGQSGLLLNADVNGDGAVNSKDLTETVAATGDKVGAAPTSFPQFQLFAGAAGPAGAVAVAVTQTQVQALLPEAIAGWRAAGLDPADIRRLEGVQVEVGNLGTSILGLEAADVITINQTAAGYNWYVNAGTGSTRVFGLVGPGGESVAGPGSPAVVRVDLLTVLEHELGHVIGLPDNAQAGDLMDITLGLGVRRAPTAADLTTIARASSTAVPASAAEVTARVLTSDGQLPQPLPLDGSVSKAAVDAALASMLSAAAGNDDARDPTVNGGSPAQSVGRFSAIAVRPGRRNQSPQTPRPFRRPPTSLFPQIIRRLVVPSASVFKPFETERGN